MTAAIKITYWAEQKTDSVSIYDFEGIEDFRKELDENYVAVVQGRPSPLGGLHELAIEFISNLTLVEVTKFLLGGIAFDVIKSGAKAFILRPFLHAYQKLKDRNPSFRLDIEEFRIVFKDTLIVIYKITEDSVFSKLEEILKAVAFHSDQLMLGTGERPFEIHVPVFEDPAKDRPCRFRVKLDVDETISGISKSDYFRLWGLRYDYAGDRVFDIDKGLLIDNEFYALNRYWSEMEERWRREREKGSA
jgi:hypothetical protein